MKQPQSNGAQGTNETSPAETDIPRLIPDYVVDAAKGVADGSLAGKTITREFQLDDENIALFLKSVNEGDDEKSLNMLCRFLRLNPKILLHPLISSTVYGLYQNPLLWMQSPALAEKKVAEVTKAIAEGLTHGWTVEVTKPSVLPQGSPPKLFPHRKERDGWMPTAASMEDSQDLFELLGAYHDLHERLRKCGNWKALCALFRTNPEQVVEERAIDVHVAFEEFKRDRRWSGHPVSEADCRRMVHDCFYYELIKNNSPRYALTCELLATLHHRTPPEVKITASLIHSTIIAAKKLIKITGSDPDSFSSGLKRIDLS